MRKLGFTLIELLVVIAIIGILSAVVVTSLTGARAGAADAKQIATIQNIVTAFQIEQDNNGDYPAFDDLSSIATATITADAKIVTTEAASSGTTFCVSYALTDPDGTDTHYIGDQNGTRYASAPCS